MRISVWAWRRQLENIVAALGIGGAIVTDIGMVTGTGLLGIVFGAGAVVSYVWCHMEHVNGDKNGRLRFIDVSPTHEVTSRPRPPPSVCTGRVPWLEKAAAGVAATVRS